MTPAKGSLDPKGVMTHKLRTSAIMSGVSEYTRQKHGKYPTLDRGKTKDAETQ